MGGVLADAMSFAVSAVGLVRVHATESGRPIRPGPSRAGPIAGTLALTGLGGIIGAAAAPRQRHGSPHR